MNRTTRGAICALVAALAGACGDDGETSGEGGAGGGATASTAVGSTSQATAAATTTTTTASSSTSGSSTGSGGEGTGGEAAGCDAIAADDEDVEAGGTLELSASLSAPLGDPDLPDRIDVGYTFEDEEFELTGVINDNLATCEQCVVVYQDLDDEGVPARVFFQSGGLMDVDEDGDAFPFAEITLTGVTLVEVTVDEDGISTLVEDGACLELEDVVLEYAIPEGWTCTPAFFGDHAGCDCGCGAFDPDCADETQAVFGCGDSVSGEAVCEEDGTCAAPAGWTCDDDAYGNNVACDCECGVPDPDCLPGPEEQPAPVANCEPDQLCSPQNQCVDPPPDGWTCAPFQYDTGGPCDCECGVYDPDCDAGGTVFGCAPGQGCTAEGTCGVPATWTCDDAQFDDDTTCDCECGGNDPDCSAADATAAACADDEVCAAGSCVQPAGNDTCDTAIPLVEGTTEGNWVGSANDYDPGMMSCTNYAEVGGDVVYTVSLLDGQSLRVQIAGAPADSALYLVTDCADEGDSCVAGVDTFSGDEVLNYTATEDIDLFLIVDQYADTDQVPFTLEVNITP
jgi:hypothetical protein